MTTKQRLLALLEAGRGQCLSGEVLATRLGVSRAAVWKAVKALRADGHEVSAAPGGGYTLEMGSDRLTTEGLAACFGSSPPALRVREEVDSTSLAAKRWAMEGAPTAPLVVADRQTGGRGRRGRSFASPPGGVYMSVVLRPDLLPQDAVLVTAGAAVAVCRAVQSLCGISLCIKWVNDLFYEGRKCCGILSEAGTSFEDGGLEYIVVGIGVNYTTPEDAFPTALREGVASLYPGARAPVTRSVLVAEIYRRLMDVYAELPATGFMEEYRARSLVLGRRVEVLATPPYAAEAVAIDERARLVVRGDFGERCLSSGEISIRLEDIP